MRNLCMYSQEHRLQVDDRVRLKSSVDPSIYGDFACAGNEGTVRAIDKDRFGLPQVLVEWDKNHWTYNGISDTWTIEDHFEKVENMASDDDKINSLLSAIGEGLRDLVEPKEKKEAPPTKGDGLRNRFLDAIRPLDETGDQYDKAVADAQKHLGESEAFLLVGLMAHPHEPKVVVPYVISNGRTPEGEILVTTKMASIAAAAHQELAYQVIHQMQTDE